MTVELRQAQTRADLEAVFALRHRVFAVEEGRLPPRPDGLLFDRFDSFSETVSLIATVDGIPAGSIRITLDGPLGSPLDAHYELDGLRARCLDAAGRPEPTAVVTSLCVRADMRRIPHVTGGLLEAAVDVMARMGAVHVIAIINPMIGALMQRVGLVAVGEPRYCPRVDQHLLSMHARLSDVAVPRMVDAALAGAIRYLAAGERLGEDWSVVLSGRLTLPGGRQAGPGAVVGGPGIRAQVPATVRVLGGDAVQRLVDADPHEALQRAGAVSPARGDLFNDMLRARTLGALDSLGVIPLLDGSASAADIAASTDLDPSVLRALLRYLESEGLVEEAGGWRLLEPERLQGELAFLRWLTGGYGPLLDDLTALARGDKRFGEDIQRDDAEMAASSAEIGRRFTDGALLGLLSSPDVRRIADVGCGGGERLVALCQQLPQLSAVGIDLSPDCCRQARDNVAEAGLSQRIEVIEARAEDWLAEQGAVDLVMCVGMFHDLLNIPGAAESFLAGVRAGLASGGLLVVQDQLAATTAGAGAWGPGFTLIHHLMGQRLFTEAECVAAFSAAGFRLLRRLATDIPDNWIFLLQAE